MAAGVAGLAAAGLAWEAARRRDVARLEADPDRYLLTAVPPGRPASLTVGDGTRLHARVADTAPEPRATIVLVHGWGMTLRFWQHQARDLQRDHVVVTYDQRGHGASSEVGDDGFAIDALGDDLAAVIEAFALPGLPVVLVGHSLGGMAVLAAGRREEVGERVAGAVLLDTASSHVATGMFRGLGVLELLAGLVGARALRMRLPIPRRTTPISSRVVRLVGLSPAASPAAVALTEQLFVDTPVDVRAAIGVTIGSLDLDDVLPRWKVPTTVAVGSRDWMTPVHHSRRLAESLPDARFEVLDGAGHQSPIEQPARITALIRAHTET